MNVTDISPHLIAFEMTRNCYLNCKHCRAAAGRINTDDELSTGEIFKILDNIGQHYSPIIILTGGEPMTRPDIYEIARHGAGLGLRMTMAPCGMLIDEQTIKSVRESGIRRISLSLDGATAETHDGFRQTRGSFDSIINAAKLAAANDVEFQINTTVHKNNIDEIPAILELAVKLGAKSLHPFILVPVGRAKKMDLNEITPEEYESLLEWFARMRDSAPIFFKPTCAPHYHRIIAQTGKHNGPKHETSGSGMHSMTKGCMGGSTFGFISSTGGVQICGFLDIRAGSLRSSDYDFHHIWNTSEFLKEIRNTDNYHGKCGYCGYKKICGGCRARAYAYHDDYLAEEPLCLYAPCQENTL